MPQYTLSIPETLELEEVADSGKKFTSYAIKIELESGESKIVHRRFHEFREFDKVCPHMIFLLSIWPQIETYIDNLFDFG